VEDVATVMPVERAFSIISGAVQNVQGTLQDHQILQRALAVIGEELQRASLHRAALEPVEEDVSG